VPALPIVLVMFEGGMAGASATALAADRRSSAQRLLSEAARLEAVAADERRIAAELATLPASYTILHDLLVPGRDAALGHVVVGPGGAFLVVSHRHDAELDLRDDQLFLGGEPVAPVLRAIRDDADVLAEALGTPVRPVVALFGPEPSAEVLDGSLALEDATVCTPVRVARSISRGSHTLLASRALAEVSERALPLLTTPATVGRGTAGSVHPEPAEVHVVAETPALPPVVQVEEHLLPLPEECSPAGRSRDTRAARGPARSGLAAAALTVLCLVAFAGGSLIRVLSSSTPSGAAGLDGIAVHAPTTQLWVEPASAATPARGEAVPMPEIDLSAVCPVAGGGWQVAPEWSAVDGVASFEVEAQGFDGTWTRVATVPTAQAQGAALLRLAPSSVANLRITAVAADGRRSQPADVQVVTPSETC
jgi:hypothetical protein